MENVLLGFPDDVVSGVQSSAFDSFIGGEPMSFLQTTAISFLPYCPNCSAIMSFILQLYCPIDRHHRVMFFFSCLRVSCQKLGNCWRVLKLQTRSAECPTQAEPIDPDEFAWKLNLSNDEMDENAWFNQPSDPKVSDVVSEPSFPLVQFKSPFTLRFINAFDETEEKTGKDSIAGPNNTLESWVLEYQAEAEFAEEDDFDEPCIEDRPETFLPLIRHAPMTSRFETHLVTRNPKHGCEVIRYSLRGEPIFVSDLPRLEWKPHLTCSRCGCPRVFEVQIFPTINNALTISGAAGSQAKLGSSEVNLYWPLDMATLMVFTCKDPQCGISEKPEYVEECVLIQTESGRTVFIEPSLITAV